MISRWTQAFMGRRFSCPLGRRQTSDEAVRGVLTDLGDGGGWQAAGVHTKLVFVALMPWGRGRLFRRPRFGRPQGGRLLLLG